MGMESSTRIPYFLTECRMVLSEPGIAKEKKKKKKKKKRGNI